MEKYEEKILSDILDFQAEIMKAQSRYYQDLARIYDAWATHKIVTEYPKQQLLNEDEAFEKVR